MQYGQLELKPRLLPRLLEVPVAIEDLDEDIDYGARELSHGAHAWVYHHVQTRRGERERESRNNRCEKV